MRSNKQYFYHVHNKFVNPYNIYMYIYDIKICNSNTVESFLFGGGGGMLEGGQNLLN